MSSSATTEDSTSDPSPIVLLQRHSELYSQVPPLYIHLDQPPTWHCLYMGNTTGADGGLDSDGQRTVARLMLILVTVNRPIPEFVP
jgi:hypothetical protein